MNADRSQGGVLVCLVGIDGAGKSTLAKAIIDRTKEQGINWRYVWGGFTSSFTLFRPLMAVMKRSLFRGNKHMEESRTKGRALKNSRLSTIYQYLVLVDYIFQTFFRIRLPLAFNRNVIVDRYIYDLTTSIGVLLDYPTDRTLTLLDRCLTILPKPDLVFMIDLPEDLAYQRKDDIVSLEFLSVRRKLYLRMAEVHGMSILDGSSDPGELARLVEMRVLEYVAGES